MEMDADWFMHNDADEFRYAPDARISLREAFYRVDRAGFNAVDLTYLNFRPVDDSFVPGKSPEAYLHYFEFPLPDSYYVAIRAWKNLGHNVEVAASGGHDVGFLGRRVFPYKFLSKHYPIRSQRHGEIKIFSDRLGRFSARERNELGWHTHYDELSRRQSFLWDAGELIRFDERFEREYLIERLSGIGARPDD